MKTSRWTHAAVSLVLAGCTAEPATDDVASSFIIVADMQQLMAAVVEPSADVYWDAAGVIIDEEGVHELAPTSDEEWEAVRNAAMMIAESGNLMMMEGRALDQGAWIAMSQAMVQVGIRAVEAAEARDVDAVFDMGAEVYYVCTNCHATYAIETLPPNDARTN